MLCVVTCGTTINSYFCAVVNVQNLFSSQMDKRLILTAVLAVVAVTGLRAAVYDEWFEDKTLRIDFVFSGHGGESFVGVDELVSFNGWAGRRDNLLDAGPEGNACVLVKDLETGEHLYKHPFSSLMQEWMVTDEAEVAARSFENPVLVPFPKKDVIVEVYFRDSYGDYVKSYAQAVSPDDILIKDVSGKDVTNHEFIHKSGDPRKCIDLVLLPEGYSFAERDKWVEDVRKVKDILFGHAPFDSYEDKFNVIRVDTFSFDSGVSVPHEAVWKSTVLGAHFDTFYSERYLTTRRMKSLHTILEGIPYEHIIIIANSDVYGGGGIYNYYMLTSDIDNYPQVLVHEFGHSFAGLGDEYYYEDFEDISLALYKKGVEPWEPNLTTLTDFESKWADLVPDGVAVPTNDAEVKEVGAFEGGGNASKGVFRPVYDDCRMKNNESKRFCPVCERAIGRVVELQYNK